MLWEANPHEKALGACHVPEHTFARVSVMGLCEAEGELLLEETVGMLPVSLAYRRKEI